MAENPSGSTEPLDVQRIHYLVRLMKRYDLTALDVNAGSMQVRLRRHGPPGAIVPIAPAPPVAPGRLRHFRPESCARSRHDPAAESRRRQDRCHRKPHGRHLLCLERPDAPLFVSVGSVVQPDTIVCIIEAMKVFTDIPAGVAGTIAEILVKNGQASSSVSPVSSDSRPDHGLERRRLLRPIEVMIADVSTDPGGQPW